MKNLLFICSKNKWRSPTGEAIYRKDARVNVRSAGTSRGAKRKVSIKDIRWADVILVMEEKHKSRIRADFRGEIRYKDMHVLDIPDDYQFMDPDLIEILKANVENLVF